MASIEAADASRRPAAPAHSDPGREPAAPVPRRSTPPQASAASAPAAPASSCGSDGEAQSGGARGGAGAPAPGGAPAAGAPGAGASAPPAGGGLSPQLLDLARAMREFHARLSRYKAELAAGRAASKDGVRPPRNVMLQHFQQLSPKEMYIMLSLNMVRVI